MSNDLDLTSEELAVLPRKRSSLENVLGVVLYGAVVLALVAAMGIAILAFLHGLIRTFR